MLTLGNQIKMSSLTQKKKNDQLKLKQHWPQDEGSCIES